MPSGRFRYKYNKRTEQPQDNGQPMGMKVCASLDKNIEFVRQLFIDVDIMRYREIRSRCDDTLRCFLVFSDGMVDAKAINDNIIHPLTFAEPHDGDRLKELMSKVLQINEVRTTDSFLEIIEAVTYGDSALFVEEAGEAILINTKHFALRSIEVPDSERTLSGPRDGFNESLMQNLSLIRRTASDARAENQEHDDRKADKNCRKRLLFGKSGQIRRPRRIE